MISFLLGLFKREKEERDPYESQDIPLLDVICYRMDKADRDIHRLSVDVQTLARSVEKVVDLVLAEQSKSAPKS